jgi:hypothetical protein
MVESQVKCLDAGVVPVLVVMDVALMFAAGIQQDDLVLQSFDEQMIEANLTKFVDQDSGVGKLRVLEQRDLASAEESRQHRDRYEIAHVTVAR